MPCSLFRRLLLAILTGLMALVPSLALGAPVHVLTYDGAITPAASEYLVGGIARAEAAGAAAVIIQLDTPGGLDTAMREIVKAELAATVPVVVYVAPSGSRAASAGAFITLAAHVAAMAPGTNIGSASPVQLGGGTPDSTMAHKVANDAVAYIDAIAAQRGRNVELARSFVATAANVTAIEARERGVVDLLVPTLPALLDSLQGRTVHLGDATVILDVVDAPIVHDALSWRQRLLKRLADPNLAYILMLLGIYGLFFELSNPGALVPGILGGICLLLALFAFQALPINYAGIGLILLGVIMLVLEVKVHSYGGLTIGGLAAITLGSLLAFNSGEPWARLKVAVLVPGVAVFAGFFLLCVALVVRSRRRPPVSGRSALIGERGRVVRRIPGGHETGKVIYHGEVWDAVAEQELAEGQRIEVIALKGRVAQVRPVASLES